MKWFVSKPKEWVKENTKAEKLGEWLVKIVKWTSDALFNTLAWVVEWARWWASKLTRAVWSKDPDVREGREKVGKHLKNQSKKSFKRAGKWLVDAAKWVGVTAWWLVWTVGKFLGWAKDAYKGLRDGDDSWSSEGTNSSSGDDKDKKKKSSE